LAALGGYLSVEKLRNSTFPPRPKVSPRPFSTKNRRSLYLRTFFNFLPKFPSVTWIFFPERAHHCNTLFFLVDTADSSPLPPLAHRHSLRLSPTPPLTVMGPGFVSGILNAYLTESNHPAKSPIRPSQRACYPFFLFRLELSLLVKTVLILPRNGKTTTYNCQQQNFPKKNGRLILIGFPVAPIFFIPTWYPLPWTLPCFVKPPTSHSFHPSSRFHCS